MVITNHYFDSCYFDQYAFDAYQGTASAYSGATIYFVITQQKRELDIQQTQRHVNIMARTR